MLSDECLDLALDMMAKVEALGLPRDTWEDLRGEVFAMLQWRLETGLARKMIATLFPIAVRDRMAAINLD